VHQDKPQTELSNTSPFCTGIKLKINSKKIHRTPHPPNMWKLNNILLNNPWEEEGITGEIRKYFE
jgi:hypothetical protein